MGVATKNRKLALSRFALFLLLLVGTAYIRPAEVLGDDFKVPILSGPVVDRANMLKFNTKHSLAKSLVGLSKRGNAQLAILTLPHLSGLAIEEASIRIVDNWKLGDREQDNGVLLLIAKKERKIRIEVGQGLEGVLTDAHSKRIIDEYISPLFKKGDFDAGILLGAVEIIRRCDPEFNLDAHLRNLPLPTRGAQQGGFSTVFSFIFVIILFVLFGMLSLGGTRNGYGRGGYWHGGGGGFGGGGGGFGGGGGGFSGGGASGGW